MRISSWIPAKADIYKGNPGALTSDHEIARIVICAALRFTEFCDIFVAALNDESSGVVQAHKIKTGSGSEH
jgi:hypothetical protein